MQTVSTVKSLRDTISVLRENGNKIGFVPTMGALHAGHMSLVEEAKKCCDVVVVSIFVNPIQFDQADDLQKYPKQLEADSGLLKEAGVALLYTPTAAEMYPNGFATSVSVSGVSDELCGAARPGHFDGVATVVSKLFLQVQPDIAFFGEKDYQQLMVVRRMVHDLDIPVEVMPVATMRESDGLAMSSRNAHLDETARANAAHLYKTLNAIAGRLKQGTQLEETLEGGKQTLLSHGFDAVDYLELRSAEDLTRLTQLSTSARLFVAARIGGTRLIDNIAVE